MEFEDKTFILGIGAQKAGTSWLHNYLAHRPDIYMPKKEMHYFDVKYRPDLRSRPRKHRTNSVSVLKRNIVTDSSGLSTAYRDYFRMRVPVRIEYFGEITPSYSLIGIPGFSEIHELFPKIRLIFIMRDPVERFYSQVRMGRHKRFERRQQSRSVAQLICDPAYVERSKYETTVADIESVFSTSNILYLFYERLFHQSTIRLLCNFLGVRYVPADFDSVVNPSGPREVIATEIDRLVWETFESTYKFCSAKFGAALPEEWNVVGRAI